MVGALTSGRLADTLGRKMVNYFTHLNWWQYLYHLPLPQTMRLAAIVGIFGWLAIYLAKVYILLAPWANFVSVVSRAWKTAIHPWHEGRNDALLGTGLAGLLHRGPFLCGEHVPLNSQYAPDFSCCFDQKHRLRSVQHLILDLAFYATALTHYPHAQVPVFISEIAPKDLRGGLAASNQVGESPTDSWCMCTKI